MFARLPSYRPCDGCGVQFCGQGFRCPPCKANADRRRFYATRRPLAARRSVLSTIREAAALGDADLVGQALRGELD